jgi:hypothetical protein
MAYDARLRAFTQKWQDLRVISLRIAGKSPWLRDECVTVLTNALSAQSSIHTGIRG